MATSIGGAFSCVCEFVCVCVCLYFKIKTAWAIHTEVGRDLCQPLCF